MLRSWRQNLHLQHFTQSFRRIRTCSELAYQQINLAQEISTGWNSEVKNRKYKALLQLSAHQVNIHWSQIIEFGNCSRVLAFLCGKVGLAIHEKGRGFTVIAGILLSKAGMIKYSRRSLMLKHPIQWHVGNIIEIIERKSAETFLPAS